MSALRLHAPGQPVVLVDLGPAAAVPLHGHATLRGHAVVAESEAGANRRHQREHKARAEAFCADCGQPLRYDRDRYAWSHVERGADHAPHVAGTTAR